MENLTLQLTNIQHSFGAKELFSINRLAAYYGDRIGIIGNNGQGKSTLLNIIAGQRLPQKGTIQAMIAFNYLEQSATIDEQLNNDQLDGELLGRLRVPNDDVSFLSGGEAAKYRLTQVLSSYQQGLLLDEPTTHLDQRSIALLLEELRYFYGTILFVSHDRSFLNQLATKIWCIEDQQVVEYTGNYDAYLAQQEHDQSEQQRAFEQYRKEKSKLEAAITKKQEQARKVAQVSNKKKQKQIKPSRLSASKQKDSVQKAMQKTAKSLETRLTKLDEVKPLERTQAIVFPKATFSTLHNKLPIRGEQVTLSYGNRVLLEKVDFQFASNQTIAITGDNGAGKSTLLKHIVNHGEGIILSPKVKFATYHQMDYQIKQQCSLLTYLKQRSDYSETVIRSLLSHLGFGSTDLSKALADLSGGEATRIAIALLFAQPSNVLILDEPTNFIDLKTIQTLEKLIKAYPGMVLLTSHDQSFVSKVANQIYQINQQKLTCLVQQNHVID